MLDSDESYGKVFSYSNVVYAFSGSVAAAFSLTLLFPLETVRTRLQVSDKLRSSSTVSSIVTIIHQEGWYALYRGWWSLIVSISVNNFAYFYTFHCLRVFVFSTAGDLSMQRDFISGLIAGCVAVFTSSPLWVANTRLKLQGLSVGFQAGSPGFNGRQLPAHSGIIDCLWYVACHDGLLAWWHGLLPSLVLVFNPAINFMVYEALKRNVLPILALWVNASGLYFAFGGVSKLVATLVTYPVQVFQTQARVQVAAPDLLHMHIRDVFGALYRGMESKLIQTVLTAALMLTTYEHIVSVVYLLLAERLR